METLKKTMFLVVMALPLFMMSCGSDDDAQDEDDQIGFQLVHAGEPHNYEFTFTGGELDGETRSGEIESTTIISQIALANYSAYTDFAENGRKDIDLHIFNDDMIIMGGFFYKNNQTNDFSDVNSSDFSKLIIQIAAPNLRYTSVAGTIELSEIDFTNSVGINEVYAGLAAYNITFDGTFVNFTTGQEVNIAGTVKVNFPSNVEDL